MAELTPNFALFNTQQTKQLAIAVIIDGVPGIFSSGTLFKKLRYGEPLVYYGDGHFYGQLIPVDTANGGPVRNWLVLDASTLTLSQKLEPEQGRGSVSMLTLAFLDVGGYMSQISAPGIIVDELLGKDVQVLIGYQDISYPEDYFQVFRGIISGITNAPTVTSLQLSDGNLPRRQNIFFAAKTALNGAIDAVQTTIAVASNSDFHQSIFGPDGTIDPALRFYMTIENEIIEYGPTANLPSAVFGTNTLSGVVRGARGTVAAAHDDQAEVNVTLQLFDHGIDAALKIMLSGWDGPWISAQPIGAFRTTGDPILLDQANAIILPQQVDAVRTYNLQVGDQLVTTGATNAGNNQTLKVVSFGDLDDTTNRIVYVDQPMVAELPTSAEFSIRSQYDTYPDSCASQLKPVQVDIERHLFLKETFLSADENSFRFYAPAAQPGKTFTESQLYLPLACYSLTRFGMLSVGLTKPPIADQRLTFLSADNILNPQELRPTRGVNNRKFFNEVSWDYDKDDSGEFVSKLRRLDSDSISLIKISSVLPIEMDGGRTDLGVEAFIDRRSTFILSRYKRGAVEFSPKVNFETAMKVEAGDIVAVKDDGGLHISNTNTGSQDLGVQLFEVTERSLDLKTGNATLKLTAGVGGSASDRFGVISPSSRTDVGSTNTELIIKDSYGKIFPGNEKKKWANYFGQMVTVHDQELTYSETVQLVGFDPANPYKMLISPALSIAPPADYVIDIINYPNDPDPTVAQIYKVLHDFLDPSPHVVSAPDHFNFVVSPSDIGKFAVAQTVLVHESEWAFFSPEVKVTAVNTGTNQVTVSADLGFTPLAGYIVELIGFPDAGTPYRFI